MKSKNKKYPCEDAFLTNPIASVNDRTGYGIKIPMSDQEADSLSDMFEDVPTTPSRFGTAVPKERKTRNTEP